MSDLIRYVAGNGANIDHFPGEILRTDPDGNIGTPEYPAGFTRDQLMILLWRVKKWNITGSLSVIDGTNPLINGTFDASALTTFFDSDSITPSDSETAIVNEVFSGFTNPDFKFLSNTSNGTYLDNSTFGGTAAALAGFATCEFGIHANSRVIYYDSGSELFYPSFNMFFGVDSNNPSDFTYRFDPDIIASGPFDIAITLDPVLFPSLELWSEVFSTDNWFDPAFGGTCAGSMTVTAVEFWPYKNSAGLPIYDNLTGAQINDPFG